MAGFDRRRYRTRLGAQRRAILSEWAKNDDRGDKYPLDLLRGQSENAFRGALRVLSNRPVLRRHGGRPTIPVSKRRWRGTRGNQRRAELDGRVETKSSRRKKVMALVTVTRLSVFAPGRVKLHSLSFSWKNKPSLSEGESGELLRWQGVS